MSRPPWSCAGRAGCVAAASPLAGWGVEVRAPADGRTLLRVGSASRTYVGTPHHNLIRSSSTTRPQGWLSANVLIFVCVASSDARRVAAAPLAARSAVDETNRDAIVSSVKGG